MVTADIDVRYRDIDTMGHVNNAVYVTYLEQARNVYFQEVIGIPLADVDTVIVTLEINYVNPIDPTDAVEVDVDVGKLGTSSIPMTYEVRADGDVAATATTVMVTVNEAADASRPLPEDWRAAIESNRDD